MKLALIIFLNTLLSSIYLNAQTVDTLKIDTHKQEIAFAKLTVTAKTEITELIKLFGNPDRIEKIAGKDRYYIYDKLGISFDAGKKGLVEALIINYNYDNDKKASKEKYIGRLLIDNLVISEKTNTENIKQSTNIKNITCIGTSLCISDPKSQTMTLMLGFTDKAVITQIILGFTNQ